MRNRGLRRRLRKLENKLRKTEKRLSELHPKFLFAQEDFTGVWVGPDLAVNRKGGVKTIKTIQLACDSRGVITGCTSWVSSNGDNVGFDSTNISVAADTEQISGLVNIKTGIIRLVEKEENSTFEGRIVKNDSLRLEQTQPGLQPVVSLMELPKVKSTPNVACLDILNTTDNPPPIGFR